MTDEPADAPVAPDLPDANPDAPEAPEALAQELTEDPAAPAASTVRFGRLRTLLARIPVPRPKTKKGVLLLAGAALVVGAGIMFAGVEVVHYSESTSFCTVCHTMIPQQKAHAASVHAEVECGSCHVGPGVYGFVKAKLEGTRELYSLVTNTYPRPIPPIEHAKMPSTTVTCMTCHPIEQIVKNNTGPSQLVLRATFAQDETNSRKDLAVLLRPVNAGTKDALSVHWHVETPVTFTSDDDHLQTADTVEFTDPKTGEFKQYIAVSKIRQSNNAVGDIERLKATEQVRIMDCNDCHNRVGHGVPSVQRAVDDALAAGKIDATLPYVKRNSVALLTKPYTTDAAAQTAISGFGDFYQQQYPVVASQKTAEIAQASKSLKQIYELIATPAMNSGNLTYADNLGHQNAPGCFRCHDGAHYRVVDNRVTTESIPSTCNTCHTFPQLASGNFIPQGATQFGPTSAVPVGEKPADHNDTLWVFNHRNVAPGTNPANTSCGSCHTPSYCSTCHDSGAIKVDHYEMLYNHAQSVRDASGTAACAVCHQSNYCEQCHKGEVLGPSNSHLDKPAGG